MEEAVSNSARGLCISCETKSQHWLISACSMEGAKHFNPNYALFLNLTQVAAKPNQSVTVSHVRRRSGTHLVTVIILGVAGNRPTQLLRYEDVLHWTIASGVGCVLIHMHTNNMKWCSSVSLDVYALQEIRTINPFYSNGHKATLLGYRTYLYIHTYTVYILHIKPLADRWLKK